MNEIVNLVDMRMAGVIVPILLVLGWGIRGIHEKLDRAIPTILVLCGGVLLCLFTGEWNGKNFVIGMVIGAQMNYLNQQYRQVVNGHGGSRRMPKGKKDNRITETADHGRR